MTIEILKSQDSRNRNSIAVMNSKFFLYQSLRWTLCSPFWKSPTRDVTSYLQADWTTDLLEDTIPPSAPPPPNPTWSMMNFMCRTCSLCYPWEFSLRMYSTDSNKSNVMNYRWAIPKTIPGNFISISMLCSTFARHLVAAVAAYLINVTRLRQHCSSWLLVFTRRFWLFCLLHMDHRWKQSCDWRSHRTANVAWTPSKK